MNIKVRRSNSFVSVNFRLFAGFILLAVRPFLSCTYRGREALFLIFYLIGDPGEITNSILDISCSRSDRRLPS